VPIKGTLKVISETLTLDWREKGKFGLDIKTENVREAGMTRIFFFD